MSKRKHIHFHMNHRRETLSTKKHDNWLSDDLGTQYDALSEKFDSENYYKDLVEEGTLAHMGYGCYVRKSFKDLQENY